MTRETRVIAEKELATGLERRILRRVPVETLVVACLMAVIIGLIFDVLSALLCFAGGLASCLSFIWMKKSIPHQPSSRHDLKTGRLLAFAFLRLGLIGLIFLIIIYFFSTRALAFMAGLVALILAMAGEVVFSLREKDGRLRT